MDIVKGKIGNALTSAASNHVVATANDIYDESISKYQNEINNDFYSMPIAIGLSISTKYDADNNLVLNVPFSQGGKLRDNEVIIPLATSINPGLMQASEHNDLKTLVANGVVHRNITFETDENNPDNVELSYYSYAGDGTWTNNRIRIPLAENSHAGLIPWTEINKLKELMSQPLLIGNLSCEPNPNKVIIHCNQRGGHTTANIPLVNQYTAGLISPELYNKVTYFLNAHPIIDVFKIVVGDTPDDIVFCYMYLDTDGLYKSGNINFPLATSNNAGVMTPAQAAFIEYNQGHNTYDDFADIPANKHICLVDLTGIAAAEGESSKALTAVMEGVGKYDGAEVLLYCHHDGAANLGIGVPASSTNGAEYVLIPNDGDEYIHVGTQELDFILSCTYINNKWYVKKL